MMESGSHDGRFPNRGLFLEGADDLLASVIPEIFVHVGRGRFGIPTWLRVAKSAAGVFARGKRTRNPAHDRSGLFPPL